jgi:nicotinamidase-related amidase
MVLLAVLASDLSPVRAEHDPRLRAAVTAALPTLGRFLADLRGLGAPVVHVHTSPVLIPAQSRRRAAGSTRPVRLTEDQVGGAPEQVPSEAAGDGDLLLRGCPPERCCASGVGTLLRRRGVAEVVLVGAQHHGSMRAIADDVSANGFRLLVPREGLLAASRAEQVRTLRALASSCATVMSMARILARARATSQATGR